MDIEKLFEIREVMSKDKPYAKQIDIIFEIIDDWPKEVHSLDELMRQIRDFIGNQDITIATLKSKINKLQFSHDAWEIEALSGMIKLLEYSKRPFFDEHFLKEISGKSSE